MRHSISTLCVPAGNPIAGNKCHIECATCLIICYVNYNLSPGSKCVLLYVQIWSLRKIISPSIFPLYVSYLCLLPFFTSFFSPTPFLCPSDHNSFSPSVHPQLFPPFYVDCLGVYSCYWVTYWGRLQFSLSVAYRQLLYCLNAILSPTSESSLCTNISVVYKILFVPCELYVCCQVPNWWCLYSLPHLLICDFNKKLSYKYSATIFFSMFVHDMCLCKLLTCRWGVSSQLLAVLFSATSFWFLSCLTYDTGPSLSSLASSFQAQCFPVKDIQTYSYIILDLCGEVLIGMRL